MTNIYIDGVHNGGIYYIDMGQPWTKANAPGEGWVSITGVKNGGAPGYTGLMAACSKNTNRIYISQNHGYKH